MIQHRNIFVRLSQYVAVVAIALMLMVVGVLVQQSYPAAAAGCNTVLTDYDLPGDPSAYYYNPAFYDGKCVDGGRAFPNTGWPYSSNGNVDSVGYVIPRTYKSNNYDSEALAYVNTKTEFYDKLRFHYYDRVVKTNGQLGYWAKDGAAFVVFSFIGKDPPANRNLTDADWAEFKRRLDNPNLKMSIDNNHVMTPNSGSVYDTDGRLDFAHFYDEMGLYGPALVFKINDKEVASIERKCANLLGQVALPKANPWTIRGESYVDNMSDDPPGRQNGDPEADPVVSAKPGQALEWDHDLRNNSTYNMDRDIAYQVDRSGFINGWNTSKEKSGTASGVANELFVTLTAPGSEKSRYVVQPSDGGRKLCQRITWNDGAWDDTNDRSSDWACAMVPFNFNLLPSVTGPSGVGTAGGTIATVIPRVNNQLPVNPGTTTDSPAVEWQLKRIEVPPAPVGVIPETQQENDKLPCVHYGNNCIAKGGGTRTFPAGAADPALAALNGETIAPNTPVGTRICYALSVKPYSQSSGADWRHSAPVCIKVSKQPKVQVWGHDVRTRGDIKTGTTTVNSGGTNKIFGSWVEYGGFAAGGISGFASGAALNNGNTNTDAADTANMWNKLTFANVDDSFSTSYGRYTLEALPKITDQFIGAPSGGVFNSDLGMLNSGTYNVDDVTINTSTVGQSAGVGKSIIIVSSGTVTINGDIAYAGTSGDTFTAISQVPQVIIIARNIDIANTAGRVDAWLLTTAGGAINTCSDEPVTGNPIANRTAQLNSTVCDNALTVNGPVVTDKLYLRRTAGSNDVPSAGSPAEVFNLRPDAFMWAYARASQAGKAQTVYSVELPPRF